MTAGQINFEQRKLFAAFLTALGVAMIAAGLFKPISDLLSGAADTAALQFPPAIGFVLVGIGLHLAGHWILRGGDAPLWPSAKADSKSDTSDAT